MSIFFALRIRCHEVNCVGKRICKSWTLPGEQTFSVVFLALFFLAGGLLGCLVFKILNAADSQALADYLTDYFRFMRISGVPGSGAVFWSELRFALAAILLWWTVFGWGAYPLLFAARGFLLAFSTGALLRVFGMSGTIPACLIFLVPALMWGPALFVLGSRGLCRGRKVFGIQREDLQDLILAGVLFVLCGVFEFALLPRLIPFTAEIVL